MIKAKKIITTVEENLNYFEREKDFYQVWINYCKSNIYLPEIDLKGIESGHLNSQEGPDFQGAEFELEGIIYRGDVEIHKNCHDWKRHGHHLDQRYNRVVLHLVASKKIFSVSNSINQMIPSISLLNIPLTNLNNNCIQYCRYNKIDSLKIQGLALKRLKNKSFEINERISSVGMDQALYTIILKSLGNGINKNNYERLAQLIPWRLIFVLKNKNYPINFWKTLFLGTAGLLNDKSQTLILEYRKYLQSLIEGTPLKKENWQWGGNRPKNFPQNRLSGLAVFIWQMQQPSIFTILEDIFYKRHPLNKFINEIMNAFNYQKKFYTKSNHWGRNLILELIGNVFIPLFYNITLKNKSYGFQMYLKQLYLELPYTQNYGKLKSLKSGLYIKDNSEKYFYFNQALLYMYNTYCAHNLFTDCPLQTNQQNN